MKNQRKRDIHNKKRPIKNITSYRNLPNVNIKNHEKFNDIIGNTTHNNYLLKMGNI